jgi:hypothetical protein
MDNGRDIGRHKQTAVRYSSERFDWRVRYRQTACREYERNLDTIFGLRARKRFVQIIKKIAAVKAF